jgi:hypothetical protein
MLCVLRASCVNELPTATLACHAWCNFILSFTNESHQLPPASAELVIVLEVSGHTLIHAPLFIPHRVQEVMETAERAHIQNPHITAFKQASAVLKSLLS